MGVETLENHSELLVLITDCWLLLKNQYSGETRLIKVGGLVMFVVVRFIAIWFIVIRFYRNLLLYFQVNNYCFLLLVEFPSII